MASKTQLRLTQITGSVDDTKAAAATINETSVQGVLDHLAASIKRIHGGSVFQNQTAGAFSQTIDVTGAVTSSLGANVGGDLAVGTSAAIGTDLLVGDDLLLGSDAAVLSFGADDEISLTHVADTGLLLNGASVFQFRDSAIFVGSSADGVLDIEADTTINIGNDNSGVAISIGHTTSEVTINDNLTVTGDLTVNGTTTTLDTTNLLVEDVVIGMAANAASQNQNGGLAIFSGSADSDLVIGRVANDTWGVGKKATLKGTVTTLADMTLVPLRADKFEVAGTTNYFNINSTNLTAVAAADFAVDAASDIVLDADSNVVRIKDGGTERGILTQNASLGFVLSSSAGTNLALDSNSGTVIFSQEGGAGGTSVTAMELGANTVNFGLSGESGITEGFIQFNASAIQVISGSTGLKLNAGANPAALQLQSNNANTFAFKAPGSLAGSYTAIMPGNANIAVGKVLKVNSNLGGGEYALDWESESAASYEKAAKVITGGTVTAGTGVDMSSVNHGAAPASLQVAYANADVFVNGQLLLSGTEANRDGGTVDYTVSGAQELKFAFNLEDDDIVSVFVRG